MKTKVKNPILELSFDFALNIISFCEALQKERKFVIANQLLKSGTSIGSNIHEAQSPESKADFIHKMKISSKELNETIYWLKLCHRAENYPDTENLLDSIYEIERILNTIISNSKRSL